MVRNTYIYPPEPSMRIIADIFAHVSKASLMDFGKECILLGERTLMNVMLQITMYDVVVCYQSHGTCTRSCMDVLILILHVCVTREPLSDVQQFRRISLALKIGLACVCAGDAKVQQHQYIWISHARGWCQCCVGVCLHYCWWPAVLSNWYVVWLAVHVLPSERFVI